MTDGAGDTLLPYGQQSRLGRHAGWEPALSDSGDGWRGAERVGQEVEVLAKGVEIPVRLRSGQASSLRSRGMTDGAGDTLLPYGLQDGRRARECPPYRTATAGGHGNARPTERRRPAGMGMPALQNGTGRRAWECPPYRTAPAG